MFIFNKQISPFYVSVFCTINISCVDVQPLPNDVITLASERSPNPQPLFNCDINTYGQKICIFKCRMMYYLGIKYAVHKP